MEVRKGYKQTEIGIIPENWEVKKLGELTSLRTGPFGSSLHKSDYITDGIPFINPTHIFDGELFPDRNITVSKEAVMRLSEFQLRTNDIILGRRGEMGRCAVVKETQQGWLCGSGSLIMRPNTKIVSEFLRRIISSPQVIAKIEEASVGSTMINLNQAVLFGLRIQTPSLPEQQAIAAALSDVDALLNSLDALIAKKHLIKQGSMQELLTGKKRLPGFSGEWEEKKLGELAVLSKAGINPASSPDTLFAHFSLPAFDAGAMPIIEKGSQIGSNKFLVSDNAVLISKLNPRIPRIWDPAFVPENAVCSTEFLVLVPRENIHRKFLAVLCWSPIVSYQMELHAIGTTGSHQRINPLQVLAIEVNVPKDKEEQTAIAEILSDMDAEISALEKKREKTRLLKQGMMQELLTGRIRLV